MRKMKRIMAAVMAAGLLLTSLTGCSKYYEQVEDLIGKVESVLEDVAEVSQKDPSQKLSSDKKDRTESVVPAAFLEYTLSEEDIATFETQLLLCEEMLKDEAAYADMEAEVDVLDKLACDIQNQALIAQVLYYCDMEKEGAVENYLYSSEVSTEITAECISFLVELYDSGDYDKYFDDWLDIELNYLESYSNETADLEVRNDEILAEYYALSEEEFEEKVGVLYSEFITNCNKIAATRDFESYYEYISTFGYMRDYGQQDREKLREYVKEYIIPIYSDVYNRYEAAYEELSREDKKLVNAILFNSYDSLKTDYIQGYLEMLPEDSKTGMQHMFEKETYIVTDNKNAYEGAFTIEIDVPYCYFGPGYHSSFTMIHELGHYYADLNIDTSWLSFDLCETHSQGNEVLFLSYLETVLEPQVYEVLEAYQLYYYIDAIIQGTLMDDFEETIYHLPDNVNYTTQEYDKIMYEVIGEYNLGSEEDYIRYCMEWLWRHVGISSPVYYLSYATSAMAALSLYSQSTEDYEAALEAYRIVMEETGAESSFVGTLEKAGISSVFEEDTYIRLLEILEE